MADANELFCRTMFRALRDEPVSPTDARYENFYSSPDFCQEDPVRHVAFSIENSPHESTQLLSGYRGTGKSTELRRLDQYLSAKDYHVVFIDMLEHYNLTSPIHVTDFLLTIAGAFGDALADPRRGILKSHPAHRSYFDRFQSFLKGLHVQDATLGINTSVPAGVFGAQLKFNLRGNPTFKQTLQQFLQGAIGPLVANVHEYFTECTRLVSEVLGHDIPTVLIVDSLEQLRGERSTAEAVQQSVAALFSTHAARLKLPGLHVLYTAPLYLRVREPSVVQLYGSNFHILPAIRLQKKTTKQPEQAAFDVVEKVVRRRVDWGQLLGTRARLDNLITQSGGHFRDLLRLLSEIAKRATFAKGPNGTSELPVSDDLIEASINQIQTEYLPIPDDDVLWLDVIHRSNDPNINTMEDVPRFSRLLDNHLAVGYREGLEWYDVHPLVADFVRSRAQILRANGRSYTKA